MIESPSTTTFVSTRRRTPRLRASSSSQPGRRLVFAVRDLLDLLPEHPLRVVHPVVGGAHDDVLAVALDEAQEALLAQLARGEHRVHVAAVHGLGPDVVEDHPVEVLVQLPALVPAQRVVHLRLGVDVERVRVDARGTSRPRRGRAPSRRRSRAARPRRRSAPPRPRPGCGTPQVGVVVDDDVALLDHSPRAGTRKPRMYQGSEPMCIGVESDSQSSRPSASKMPAPRSSDSRMIEL